MRTSPEFNTITTTSNTASIKVIHKVFEVALDDQHKHQTAAQKILMDRAIPVNSFDKTFDNQLGLNIHITTSDIPKVVNP